MQGVTVKPVQSLKLDDDSEELLQIIGKTKAIERIKTLDRYSSILGAITMGFIGVLIFTVLNAFTIPLVSIVGAAACVVTVMSIGAGTHEKGDQILTFGGYVKTVEDRGFNISVPFVDRVAHKPKPEVVKAQPPSQSITKPKGKGWDLENWSLFRKDEKDVKVNMPPKPGQVS